MTTKIYRYQLAGPPSTEFAKQAGVVPEEISKTSWTIDYQYDDAAKEDVDAFLLERGYEFVEEVIP